MADSTPNTPTWQDELSSQYIKILQIAPTFTTLLNETKFFKKVLRGFPENIRKVYENDIATVYFNSQDFFETMGARNRPQYVYTTIGLIAKGTKTAVHDRIIQNSIYITSRFDDSSKDYDAKWNTLNGNVRNTLITGFNIYPEQTGKSLLTTAVIQFKHDVRWHK